MRFVVHFSEESHQNRRLDKLLVTEHIDIEEKTYFSRSRRTDDQVDFSTFEKHFAVEAKAERLTSAFIEAVRAVERIP